MPEHLIRLRAAWQRRPTDAPDAPPDRIDLPTNRPDGPGPPALLSRRFRCPPIDPARERLLLRLEDVPGLRRVLLNGREIAEGRTEAEAGRPALEVPVDGLLGPSNLLELEVGPIEGDPDTPGSPWGVIALVVFSGD